MAPAVVPSVISRHRPAINWRITTWRARSRALGVVVVAGALGSSLSACSTSPPAAMVNGQAISQGELSENLLWWASSPAYVRSFDQASKLQAEQYAAQGQQVPVFSVQGTGSGPANFGLPWTTGRLTQLVGAVAVHQYAEQHGESPSGLELSAAWASEEASYPQVWPQFPPDLRSALANEGAELSLVQAKAPDLRSAELFYKANLASFWSQVCVTTVDVSVPGAGGVTDMVASHKQADQVAAELSGQPSGGAAPPLANGARYCLTPEQLIVQPASFRIEVAGLAVGKVAQIEASWGYQVVQVRSRALIPFDLAVASVISVVALGAGTSAYTWPVQGDANDTGLTRILKAAKVEVNPAYGSWTTGLPSPPYIPQVWPAGQASP